MRFHLYRISAAITMLAYFGCTSPVKSPTAGSLPHNWLSERLSVSEAKQFSGNFTVSNIDMRHWDELFSMLQPDDEIWQWEAPGVFNDPPYCFCGVCLIRNNKVIYIFKINAVPWVN